MTIRVKGKDLFRCIFLVIFFFYINLYTELSFTFLFSSIYSKYQFPLSQAGDLEESGSNRENKESGDIGNGKHCGRGKGVGNGKWV